MAYTSSGLLLDLVAGTGITYGTGTQIATINDQSGLANHCTGAHDGATAPALTSPSFPIDALDWQSRPVIRYGLSDLAGVINRGYLVMPNTITGIASRNLTVYVVAMTYAQTNNGAFFTFGGTGMGNPFLWLQTQSNTPSKLSCTTLTSSSLISTMNKAVYCAAGGATSTILRMNNTEVSLGFTTNFTGLTGGTIGSYNAALGRWWAGDMYRIRVYTGQHNSTDRNTNCAQFISDYGIETSFDNQIHCIGDSRTYGVGSNVANGSLSYPAMVMQALHGTGWQVRNYGTGGISLGPVGTAGTLSAQAAAIIDPTFRADYRRNVIALLAGINDESGSSGAVVEGYISAYAAARKASNPLWEFWSLGELAASSRTAKSLACNQLLLAGDANINRYGNIGPGSTRAYPTLTNEADFTYYNSDSLHQIQAGTQLIADAVLRMINENNPARGF